MRQDQGARRQLDRFVADALPGYAETRDHIADEGISRLSPHLHFGELSPRQVWAAVAAAQPAPVVHDLKPGDQPLPRRPDTDAASRPLDTRAERPGTLWERFRKSFRKPPVSNNPKLVNFLAAGSIQGLRPLRYERRVARNRFLAFTTVLVLVLIGLFWTLIRQ